MTTPLESALAAVDDADAIAHARRWVDINSYTENVAGVNAVGALLGEAFALPSLVGEVIPGGAYGDHRIWRTRAPGAPIVLVGHHDTVFPPGHFEGWREAGNDRAIGPGALDMKGGLAVIRGALLALEHAGALASIPIAVISVSDEEVGSPSSKPVLEAVAGGARAGLVFESGRAGDAIITRRKGVGAMTVTARGKAAHAGNHHKDGANAIWALARFVDAAQRATDYARGRTVNVGLVSGGTSKNTVPETASCQLDLRYETIADAEALVVELRAAAAAAELPGVTVEITGGVNRLPLERTPASAALRDAYAACARAEGLGDGEAALLGGGSDANTIALLGVPVIDGLGPRGAGFHTTDEYVELATFRPKMRALVRFLLGAALLVAGCRGADAPPAATTGSAVHASTGSATTGSATSARTGSAAPPASEGPPPPKLADAIAHAAAAHHALVLEFSTDWCKPCQIFAKTTLVDPRVQAALGHVDFVRYDAEAGPGLEAAARYDVNSYPSFLAVDAGGAVRAHNSGVQLGEEGVHQFLDFIAHADLATIDESGLRARIAAAPSDVDVRLAAAQWFADRERPADAKAQYDAVARLAGATAEQRGSALAAGARIERLARWRRELVAEKLELARRAPTSLGRADLALATVDSGAAPAAIHEAIAKVLAAQTKPEVINGLVYVALAAGATDEALAAAKRAFADTTDPGELDTLAEAYHVHGDRADALRVEDRALALAKGEQAAGLAENRKRFDAGHGESSDVVKQRAEVARRWAALARIDGPADAGDGGAGDGGGGDAGGTDPAMAAAQAAAMAWYGAARKLTTAVRTACLPSAGATKEAFAQVVLDASGKVTATTLYLADGATPALRRCLTSQLVGAILPASPLHPPEPLQLSFEQVTPDPE